MSHYKCLMAALFVVSSFSCSDEGCDKLPETVPYQSKGEARINNKIKVLEGVFFKFSGIRDDYHLTLRFDEEGTRFELTFDGINLNDSIQYLRIRDTINFYPLPFSSYVQTFGCESHIYELNEDDIQKDFIRFLEIDTLNQIFKGEFELSLFLRKSNSITLNDKELLIKNGVFDLVFYK